jgi:hypothetical protein
LTSMLVMKGSNNSLSLLDSECMLPMSITGPCSIELAGPHMTRS